MTSIGICVCFLLGVGIVLALAATFRDLVSRRYNEVDRRLDQALAPRTGFAAARVPDEKGRIRQFAVPGHLDLGY